MISYRKLLISNNVLRIRDLAFILNGCSHISLETEHMSDRDLATIITLTNHWTG